MDNIHDIQNSTYDSNKNITNSYTYKAEFQNIYLTNTSSIPRYGIRGDLILICTVIILIIILVVIVSIIGAVTDWYTKLKHGHVNNWVTIILLIIAILLSYISLILLWNYIDQNKFVIITTLFLIEAFILLGWITIFYFGQNIGLSLWLAGVLFVYKLWLFIYIWYIKPTAAIFLIPILIFYIYLMYITAHLAYLNNIIL